MATAVKRADAIGRVKGVVGLLVEGRDPVSCVTELYVFGSFARGALVVGDVDVDVEYERDETRVRREVRLLSYGRNPHGDLAKALFRGQRIFQAHFGERALLEQELGGLTLLWRRGDTEEAALARLDAIAADPNAGRAARDPVVAQLEGLDRWVPRPFRAGLTEAVQQGLISLARIDLPDARPTDVAARQSIEDRWNESNPNRRAALAAAAHFERLGVKGLSAYERAWGTFGSKAEGIAIGLGKSDGSEALTFIRDGYGERWLQVINPSRRSPLHALLIQGTGLG